MSTYLPTYPAQYLRIYLVSIFLPLNLSKSAKYLCIYLSIYISEISLCLSIYPSLNLNAISDIKYTLSIYSTILLTWIHYQKS